MARLLVPVDKSNTVVSKLWAFHFVVSVDTRIAPIGQFLDSSAGFVRHENHFGQAGFLTLTLNRSWMPVVKYMSRKRFLIAGLLMAIFWGYSKLMSLAPDYGAAIAFAGFVIQLLLVLYYYRTEG